VTKKKTVNIHMFSPASELLREVCVRSGSIVSGFCEGGSIVSEFCECCVRIIDSKLPLVNAQLI
jgi:hypothetical protein